MVRLLPGSDELVNLSCEVGCREMREKETFKVQLDIRVGDDGCSSSVSRGDSVAVLQGSSTLARCERTEKRLTYDHGQAEALDETLPLLVRHESVLQVLELSICCPHHRSTLPWDKLRVCERSDESVREK